MNYREILEDFVNNENTEYCYDWQGFNYEIILPCIEQLLKNENNLQSKIDKSDELIETYKNERDTYKRLAEEYIKKYNDLLERTKEGE